MFCPECGDEYYEGFRRCDGCCVELVTCRPQVARMAAYETVMQISDAARLAVAKSILDDAGIFYYAKGEGLQDLFGLGRMGFGFNLLVGPIELQVVTHQALEARELLAPVMDEFRPSLSLVIRDGSGG